MPRRQVHDHQPRGATTEISGDDQRHLKGHEVRLSRALQTDDASLSQDAGFTCKDQGFEAFLPVVKWGIGPDEVERLSPPREVGDGGASRTAHDAGHGVCGFELVDVAPNDAGRSTVTLDEYRLSSTAGQGLEADGASSGIQIQDISPDDP